MKILSFISKLFPNLKKRDVVEEIEIALTNIQDSTLPVYQQYAKDMGSWNFATKESQQLLSIFNSIVQKRKGNVIVTVKAALEETVKIGQELSKLVDKKFQTNIVPESITYNQAQFLQFSSALTFIDRFARRLLSYLVIVETAKFDQGNTIETAMTPKHRQYVISNFTSFCMLINAVSKGHHEVMKALSSIPELEVIPENDESVNAIKGVAVMDPFKMNFIANNAWLPYYFANRNAVQNVKRYDEAREERSLLELRLIHLRNLQRGEPDPQVEREIQYNEDRLSRVVTDINDFEEEFFK